MSQLIGFSCLRSPPLIFDSSPRFPVSHEFNFLTHLVPPPRGDLRPLAGGTRLDPLPVPQKNPGPNSSPLEGACLADPGSCKRRAGETFRPIPVFSDGESVNRTLLLSPMLSPPPPAGAAPRLHPLPPPGGLHRHVRQPPRDDVPRQQGPSPALSLLKHAHLFPFVRISCYFCVFFSVFR